MMKLYSQSVSALTELIYITLYLLYLILYISALMFPWDMKHNFICKSHACSNAQVKINHGPKLG